MRCSETSIRSPLSERTRGHEYRAALGMNAGTGARESSRVSADFSPLAWTVRVPCRETLSSSYVLSKSVGDSPACAYGHYRKWPETVAQRYRCGGPLRPVSTYLDSCNRVQPSGYQHAIHCLGRAQLPSRTTL
jgi:hypothetical protein